MPRFLNFANESRNEQASLVHPGRVVLGIKVKHDLLAAEVFQAHGLSFTVAHREVGSFVTFF